MLKNYKSLISRVESFEPSRVFFDYREREVTKKEDYIRVVFNSAPLPPIEDSVSFRKSYHNYRSESFVLVVKRDSFFFGYYKSYYSRGRRGQIYRDEMCLAFIYIESRKVNTGGYHFTRYENSFLPLFLTFFGLEGFCNDASLKLVKQVLLNKNIVGSIVKGTLTNWADTWKRYCRLVYGIKTDFKLVEQYVQYIYDTATEYYSPSPVRVIEFTTNWQNAIRTLMKSHTSEDYRLYNDLLEDAFLLNKKVNLCWSIKRCQQEHQRNIDEILLAQESALSGEPIHNSLAENDTFNSGGTSFRILNSEKSVFKEATEMHNCIYSHYFPKIRNGNYLVLSTETEAEGKIDIGYFWDKKKRSFSFEQIHTIRNGYVPDQVRSDLLEKVDAYKDYFVQLHDELVERADPEPSESKPIYCEEVDLPF